MEEYAEFFGGVDSLDVSDLMKPALVVGGRKKKSASTVKIFSKKSVPIKRRRHSAPEDTYSIIGSGENDSICSSFVELENKRMEQEENETIKELMATVRSAEMLGGFSDSEDESLLNIDNVGEPHQFEGGLVSIDKENDYDLTALDSDESVGMAAGSLLEIDGAE